MPELTTPTPPLDSASPEAAPQKKSRSRRKVSRVVGMGIISVGLLVGLALRPTLVFATGQGNGCSLAQMTLPFRWFEFYWTRLSLLRHTAIEAVPGSPLLLHKTPVRDFYAPKGTAVNFVLAEQLTHIYGTGEYRVRAGDVVLDCGANIGTFTNEALLAGARLVVAIDPSPGNVDAMQRTFAKEIAEGRVIVYPKGVWNKDDTLEFSVYDNSALDSLVMTERSIDGGKLEKKIQVPLTTIDKLVAELGLSKIDYIKMDIEGAERQAIAGGTETIRKFHPRMSIATENLDDDYLVLPKAILAISPNYSQTCLLCKDVSFTSSRPDIMHFE